MSKVVVLGTGTMGVGIAAGFIAAGIDVVFLGRTSQRAQDAITRVQEVAASIDSLPESKPRGGVTPGTIEGWNDWNGVDWVIETVTENLELKQKLFSSLDQRVPPAIPIGSNSSGFPISKIAAGLSTAHRMFNAHYFMPAHIVPLVEIVLGEKSDPALAQQVYDFYRNCGKKPVLVRKDIPGFLANRIQHALMREALSLVQDGIATPDDIDTAVRFSFGFRYAAVGPMTQKEISGWEGMAIAAAEIYPSLSNTDHLPECVASLVRAGKNGMKAGEGFRKWSPEDSAKVRKNYDTRLKAAFEVLQLAPDDA